MEFLILNIFCYYLLQRALSCLRKRAFYICSSTFIVVAFANSQILHTTLELSHSLPPPTLCLSFCLFLCDRVSNTTAGGERGRAGGRKRERWREEQREGVQKCNTESRLTVEESNAETCDTAKRRRRGEKKNVCVHLYV